VLSPSSWWGALFKGLFSVSAAPSGLELGVWLAYLVPTMALFLRPVPAAPPRRSDAVAAAGPAAGVAVDQSPTQEATAR
jgi:high-affinity iron transporter